MKKVNHGYTKDDIDLEAEMETWSNDRKKEQLTDMFKGKSINIKGLLSQGNGIFN